MQIGQNGRQRVGTRRNAKPRQRNSRHNSLGSFLSRQAFCIFRAEFHQEPDLSNRLVREAADAEAADLDQSGQRRGGAHQQPPVQGLNMGAVVGHEPRERDEALRRRLQQRQHQPRLARA